MNTIKKISILVVPAILLLFAVFSNSSCNIYKFNEATIPDSIKTVKIVQLLNKARYVNPQISQRLSDKLRQKIVGQTKLSQTNSDNADWEISGYISEYNFSTSAISGQQESFVGAAGEKNSPRSKSFLDGVKKFFDDLTR